MDFNIEMRKKQLDHLDQLIISSRERIDSVLHYLGWSAENVEKEDSLVQCPINPNHRISPKSWTEHIEKCLVKLEGYNLNEQFLSEPVDNGPQSIYLDRNKKIEIITKELAEKGPMRLAWNGLDPDPRTSDRLISTFSSDERLVFYNYSIGNTVGPPPPPEFTTLLDKKHTEEKPLTYEEILAQERDAKRRRAKYRSVHINKKNHTEVIREVINRQMEEYKEWLLAQEQKKSNHDCSSNGDDRKEEERPHSSTSRNSNHSSSSRSTTRRYETHRRRSRESHHKKEHDRRSSERRYKKSPYRDYYDGERHKRSRSMERRERRKKDNHGKR